ncbi:MAG: nuclear transport factor 2 family protein [Novosphingobium sp.]|nr:nuclear transport factor 2 family protein [Novosphingobium sp.]
MNIEEELAQLKAQFALLKDRQDVIDCIQRESRARDRQDSEQIASCWWDEGVDEHGAVVTFAPDYPEKANLGHKMNFHMTSHNITNHLCDLDGDTAYCESYVIGGLHWLDGNKASCSEGETTTVVFGRYLDQLERRGGEWRILTRRCTIEASANADGRWVHSPNVKGFLKAIWSKDYPSYERPITWKPKEEGVRW